MASALLFFYVNLSAFHGDGTVVWLTTDGHAVVQRASRDASHIYSLEVPQTIMARARPELDKLSAAHIKVVDRLGIPDEVRIRIGFRDKEWRLNTYALWENDVVKQQLELRRLRELAQEIVALTEKQTPTRTEHVAPGKLTIELPNSIARDDLDAALK